MKKNKPQISVVIPAYNEALYIEPCLKSLENQTLNRNKYEIIVVDGNSTDKTREIARKYADFVLTETEKSVGKARNRGCKKASGKIIANTDADTIVKKNWLEQIQKGLSGKNVVAVYGAGLLHDGGWLPHFPSN